MRHEAMLPGNDPLLADLHRADTVCTEASLAMKASALRCVVRKAVEVGGLLLWWECFLARSMQ
eukprot:1744493-Amphidinium_carterae.1